MRKPFWIPLITAFGTMLVLYIIGFIANVNFLVFTISSTYTEIALLPIVAGLFVAFISERIIQLKIKKRLLLKRDGTKKTT